MTEKLPTPSAAVGGGGGTRANASSVNAYRIASVIERLGFNMQRMKQLQKSLNQNDVVETSNLCISLSRGIDFAIANNEVPSRAPDLPLLLKQVCQCRDHQVLQAAVMVLMVSVKNACENGWFSEKDSEDLNNLAREVTSDFCTTMDFNTEPSSFNVVIAEIMSRFYPMMIMGQILTFLEIKPGYGAFIRDFQISKTMNYSPEEKVRLFVACTDNTETSACIISPQKVNFLINGKEVDKRARLYVDRGPQMPTNVTSLMKYGSNVLQVLGQFDGNYIVLVALMSELSAIESATLQDYVQSDAVTEDPDSELIVGASRISLNCPISFKRIKTPVKGQSCKHFQCFDYDNYIAINSKIPSWRCPHCNHHCCFPEIRLDQNIAKVLREVGENVSNVIISSDGSWKSIENNDDTEKPKTKVPRLDHEEPDSTAPSNPADLIEIDDVIVTDSREAEDVKALPNSSANQSSIQKPLQQGGDNFWSGLFMSTFQPGTTNALSDPQIGALMTASMSSMPNTGMGPLSENNYMHLNQPLIRTPVAVQALPAQVQTRNNPSTLPLGASQTPPALPADTLRARLSNIEERLQNPQPHPSMVQASFPQQNSNPQPQDRTLYPAISQVQSSSPRGSQMHTPNHSAARFQQSAAAFGNGFRPQSSALYLQPQRGVVHMSRAFPTSMGPTPQPAQVNLPPDQDWRPTGRMRGSLSGQAYSAALNHYVRSQPSQNGGTPTRTNSGPHNDSSMQVLMANRAAMEAADPHQNRPAASSTPSPSGSISPMPPGLQ